VRPGCTALCHGSGGGWVGFETGAGRKNNPYLMPLSRARVEMIRKVPRLGSCTPKGFRERKDALFHVVCCQGVGVGVSVGVGVELGVSVGVGAGVGVSVGVGLGVGVGVSVGVGVGVSVGVGVGVSVGVGVGVGLSVGVAVAVGVGVGVGVGPWAVLLIWTIFATEGTPFEFRMNSM